MGQACMIAASRVTFAYARDDCFPLSKYWKHVNTTTKTPVNAVIINGVIGILLLLLIFAGEYAAGMSSRYPSLSCTHLSTTTNACKPYTSYVLHSTTRTNTPTTGALFSIGAIAQYIAFTIPIFIRLFLVGQRFRPGPWNLGRLTLPIGSIACAFVLLMTPIMCFPAYRGADLDAEGMNWTCLVYGAPMGGVLVWWFVGARKWFRGPKVNLERELCFFSRMRCSARSGVWLIV